MAINHSCSKLEPQVKPGRIADVTDVFNLILRNSAHSLFNPVYMNPRYQAGLGLQLFSIVLLGKIRLPSGTWHKAKLHVARQAKTGEFLGFCILRNIDPTSGDQEIYMCAIEENWQRKGIGRHLLHQVMDQLPAGIAVEALCMPTAAAMRRTLSQLDFKPTQQSRDNTFRIYRRIINPLTDLTT